MAKLELLSKQFPELRNTLDFGEFHPGLAGNSVDVWVNLSADFETRIHEFREMGEEIKRREEAATATDDEDAELETMRERRHAETVAIYAKLWDCTEDEVEALVTSDLVFSDWLVARTWEMIIEYRAGRTKN